MARHMLIFSSDILLVVVSASKSVASFHHFSLLALLFIRNLDCNRLVNSKQKEGFEDLVFQIVEKANFVSIFNLEVHLLRATISVDFILFLSPFD